MGKGENLKRIIIVGVIFLLTGLLPGCAWWTKKETQLTPQEKYNNALKLLNNKKYDLAAEAFRKFKEEYPLNSLTPLAELRIGDALYSGKNYAEAILQYEDFKKLHPLHTKIPYAIYQIGMSHFKQMQTVDRDQSETEKAIEQFRYLVENYPKDPQTEEARKKLESCRRQLAEHEFYIGNFYYRSKKYRAALGRFEGILQKYPDAGLGEKIRPLLEKSRVEIAKSLERKEGKKEQERNTQKKEVSPGGHHLK